MNRIPASLRRFLEAGGATYRGEDGDWEIKVEPAPKSLPAGALVIGNNGCGDHLFLEEDGRTVFVFWRDEARVEKYLDDVETLTNPPAPVPSQRKPVRYFGSETSVNVGDRVTVRGVIQFWRRFPGRVTYVPGLSKKNRDMEHGGLAWVGIQLDKGYQIGMHVDEITGFITKRVRLG